MWNEVRWARAASIFLVLPVSAMAGDGAGKVIQVIAHSHDVVFFSLDGPHTNAPACSSTPWSLSLATNSGRAQYALLLSAVAQGKAVTVHGTGDCSAWGDRETAEYILIDN
ncbi:hypothetical protein NG827_01260 [Xanthomonas sacchari]|uniref:hypothetical protein n=1 Tax=Xanthomonas sacchari TaxID=56458 RepID=UPI00225139A8|nr:hypothetical protein [Xanthomonas sacchari]UYK85078.1 hypothetical protein NG827_01260 [Xanthomonas sacchari]